MNCEEYDLKFLMYVHPTAEESKGKEEYSFKVALKENKVLSVAYMMDDGNGGTYGHALSIFHMKVKIVTWAVLDNYYLFII